MLLAAELQRERAAALEMARARQMEIREQVEGEIGWNAAVRGWLRGEMRKKGMRVR